MGLQEFVRSPLAIAVVTRDADGSYAISGLLCDPELGPVVLLAQKRDRKPDEVSPEEAAWLMAGSILELLEIGGPDAVRAQLDEWRRPQRVDVIRAVCDSSYPARETQEDFRVLVAEPILSAPGQRAARDAPARDPGRRNAAVADAADPALKPRRRLDRA